MDISDLTTLKENCNFGIGFELESCGPYRVRRFTLKLILGA
jgi:hypothetical protein